MAVYGAPAAESRAVVNRIRSLLGQPGDRSARTKGGDLPRPEWLLAGLGNPGPKYAKTRHNAGFLCLDRLAEESALAFDRTRHGADIAAGPIAGQAVWLAKPRTYMNVSGRALGPLLREAGVPPARLVVVYDELDLPFGTIRIRKDGSAGGHNGMKSIIAALGTQEFPRIRVGIGRPPGRMAPVDYVLTEFRRDDLPVLEEMRDRVAAALRVIVTDGLDAAMNQFNRRPD